LTLGFVALELSQLAIGDKLRRQVGKYARPAIIGTLVASAALNSFAFAAQASNEWMMAAAIGLGIAVAGNGVLPNEGRCPDVDRLSRTDGVRSTT
jgi:hypothetical protein